MTSLVPNLPHSLDDGSTIVPQKPDWKNRSARIARLVVHHLRKHTGVGLVCAVAYFDPGNWGVDLQAGTEFGYRLLFVVLLAGLFAVLFQTMATRLGVVTGLDLASHCRLLLHSRPKHTLLWRWLALYPLYLLAEIAIIATDLAELLGSAIALCLLFPSLQIWHGVLITTFDVILLLAMADPLRGKPVRTFEWLIGALVLAVFVCMCIIISRIDIQWGRVFQGYLPSKYIIPNGALYVSVGIIGATVMPHSLFLGSALATQDRVSGDEPEIPTEKPTFTSTLSILSKNSASESLPPTPVKPSVASRIWQFFISAFRTPPPTTFGDRARSPDDRVNNSLPFVKAHIYHGVVDVAVSLLGFAVIINSFILILAGAMFYRGADTTQAPAGLFDAYDLINLNIGKGAATLFAIALLAAGQSASIVATVAGQIVSEGFLQWRVSPVVRRLLTRLIAVVPSMVVAIALGREGIDALLVASQVVLSVVLPFVTLPLIYVTSSKSYMVVRDLEGGEEKDFSNGWISTGLAWAIWVLILIANVYVLATIDISAR